MMTTLNKIMCHFNLNFDIKATPVVPITLSFFDRDDLPRLLVELGMRVGAEIGVEGGVYSEKLCKAGLELYAIDPWTGVSDGLAFFRKQEHAYRAHDQTGDRLGPYVAHIMRTTSSEAATHFPDNFLDFVYIDADHRLHHVIEDIAIWSRKVRSGGIIAGHDYIQWDSDKESLSSIHVKTAVDAWTACYKINPWFIIPGHGKISPSWMWVNQ